MFEQIILKHWTDNSGGSLLDLDTTLGDLWRNVGHQITQRKEAYAIKESHPSPIQEGLVSPGCEPGIAGLRLCRRKITTFHKLFIKPKPELLQRLELIEGDCDLSVFIEDMVITMRYWRMWCAVQVMSISKFCMFHGENSLGTRLHKRRHSQ
jgi:hypothetical protein